MVLIFLIALHGQCLTTFTFQFLNSDGTTNALPAVLAPYPPANNLFIWNGTNIVISKPIVLTPSANGFGTNAAEPGGYRLTVTNSTGQSIQAYVNIPDTGTVFPLGAYITNAPATYTSSSFYAFLTNSLGSNAITGLLGFNPVPSTPAGITNVFTLSTLTNLLGLNGATNLIGYNGVTNLAGISGFSGTVSNAAAGITYRSTYVNGALTATNTP